MTDDEQRVPVPREALLALVRFLVVDALLATAVFLAASGWLSAWEGHVAAMDPIGRDEPTAYNVLIVGSDGEREVRTWPADVAKGLDVPVDPKLIPARTPVEQLPWTEKRRFQLHFLVREPETDSRVVPTTSPRALGLAVLLGLIAVFVRNMVVSGSPIDIVPRATVLPEALPKAGQVVPPGKGQKGHITAPPPKPKGGRRRSHR